MKTKNKFSDTIKLMELVSWIVFIGTCIKTGILVITFLISLFKNHMAAHNLYMGLDLFDLKAFSEVHYVIFILLIIVSSAFKAAIFYLVIRMFTKINFSYPFNETMALLIRKISLMTLATAVLNVFASKYSSWLSEKGSILSTASPFNGNAADLFFLSGIVFVISLVFQRGVELQAENELTV
jgi:hypothetical protein